ncbi:ROK family transcriptional regulator [Actinoplanes sp. NPDC026623]|uniref:ROK family transcriptional regulator n=1 Tax=Actinoplanes sp. NPDC026623 TaxID=3155610 RepID=UPI0033D0E8CF
MSDVLHIDATRTASVTDAMRSVFVELLVHGPMSRAEVARRLDLSPSALTKLTKPLLENGYLREQPVETRNTVGRPSLPLTVDASRAQFVGIKLTADELFGVRTDLSATVQSETRLSLPNHDVEAIVEQIATAVRQLSDPGHRIAGLGLSLAGVVFPGDPVVHASPFLGWRDVPLADLVRDRTGLPVVLDNDVRALTAAQHWFGAGVGQRSFALITVGAGIGCGLVINDRLATGHSRATGLIGHLVIDDHGPLCEQGHRGCARAYATSTAVRRSIRSALDRPDLTFEDCLALARDGNIVARRVIDDAGRALGQVVATVANLTGPDVVILSGEAITMINIGDAAFHASLDQHTHWTAAPVPVVIRPFAFNEWARGAAVAALQYQVMGE